MFAGVFFSIKLLMMSSRFTLSGALVRSMKLIYAGVLNYIAFSFICLTIGYWYLPKHTIYSALP